MREARLSWEFSTVENTEFSTILEVCDLFEVVAHLDITDEGIKQLVHLKMAPGREISELNESSFLQIEGPLPPYDLPEKGGEGYAVIWNQHELTSAIRSFGDIAIVPPYRFNQSGLTLSVRGLPKGIRDFINLVTLVFPPDQVKVVEVLKGESIIQKILTVKQQDILKDAVKHGYYDQPRRISLSDLAETIAIPRSSLGDLLGRLEGNLALWASEQLE